MRLLRFDADYQQPNADLEWSSASELNVQQFEIERGTSPLHFAKVGSVASSGNSNTINSYNFKDDLSLVSGDRFFYRLKMIDIDGRFTYSGVQLVKREGQSVNEVVMSPNPVKGSTGVACINFDAETIAELSIIDIQGRVISSMKQKIAKGYNIVPLNFSFLKNGTYTLRVETNGKYLAANF